MLQKPDFWPLSFRRLLLKFAGVDISKSTLVMSGCDFLYGSIEIKDGVFINKGCLIEGAGGITIESGVHIAPRCILLTSTHEIGDTNRRAGKRTLGKISIGAGTWLGAASTVLPGINLGRACFVGAASLVNRDVSDNELVGGVPIRKIRELSGT